MVRVKESKPLHGRALLERFPQWYFEVEDWVLQDKERYEYVHECGTPAEAKSLQMRFYKFRQALVQPQNEDFLKNRLRHTLGLMLKVRGSTVVFQDINLLSERYVSMSRPNRPFIERQPSSDFARLTQEFAPPPTEVERPEATINWDKFPPVFKQIAQVLTTQKEVRLTGTGYIKFPEEWTNLQVFGEPWASIACTYDGREVVWRRLEA